MCVPTGDDGERTMKMRFPFFFFFSLENQPQPFNAFLYKKRLLWNQYCTSCCYCCCFHCPPQKRGVGKLFHKIVNKKIDRILINRLFLLFNGYFIKEIFCFFLSFNINTAADSRSQQMMIMMTNCCCCNWHTFSLHTKKLF